MGSRENITSKPYVDYHGESRGRSQKRRLPNQSRPTPERIQAQVWQTGKLHGQPASVPFPNSEGMSNGHVPQTRRHNRRSSDPLADSFRRADPRLKGRAPDPPGASTATGHYDGGAPLYRRRTRSRDALHDDDEYRQYYDSMDEGCDRLGILTYKAILNGDLENLKKIFRQKRVCLVDKEGNTPLHVAARRGNINCLK